MQNQVKKSQLAAQIAALSEIYEKKIMGEIAFTMYWEDLKNYDINDICKAISLHRRDPEKGNYMPKPADIIRHLQKIIHGFDEKTRAISAWNKVWKAVRYPGGTDCVVFDDPVIHVVIDEMGGWISLCATEIKDAPWKAREFEERYVTHLIAGINSYEKVLLGSHKRCENNKFFNKIHFIGDKEKAEKVYAGSDEIKKIENLTINTYLLSDPIEIENIRKTDEK